MYRILCCTFIYACNLIESFLIIDFLIKLLEFKTEQKYTYIKKIGIILAIFVILEMGLFLDVGELFITALNYGILFLFCNRYLGGNKFQHSILILIVLLLIPLINVIILQLIVIIWDISLEEYINADNPYYLLGIICVIAIYYIILKIILKNKTKLKIFMSKKYSIIYSLILGYSILVEGVIFYLLQNNVQVNAYHLGLLFISCGAIGIDIYIIFTMCKISEQQKQEEKINLLRIQNIYQEQQVREMQCSEERINRLRHDYKNTISTLKELIKKQRMQESIDYLERLDHYYIKDSKEYVDTGNLLIDAVLNTKFSVCVEESIEFTSCIVGELDKIDGFKISIILFNLLDNAIEAIKNENLKLLDVELIIRGEYFSCIVKNSIKKSVLLENQNLETTKSNKRMHGFGVNHVMELVSSVNGLVDFFEKKNFFCVHIMIPLQNLST